MYKKILVLILSAFMVLMCSSCSTDTENGDEEEEIEYQTLNVADKEYYQRFRNQNITINVYNWGEYISDGADEGTLDVNEEFYKLTGIRVNYSTYATNEELYAKLKGGGASYDIIIPSDYMIARMIKEDMLLPLDLENIPNKSYIMDSFIDPVYDEGNRYSLPYTWGTVGIIYDSSVIDIPEDEIDWDILWDETYADQILMFDNPRDAFAIAEIMLGYSINTEDFDELKNAADELTKQKKVVQAYVMDQIFDKMGAGDALIAPYYAGDALSIMEDNEFLNFVIPKSGTNLFVDAMCIPSCAKNKEAAEMYINFMCEPDIAYATTTYIGYSTPNSAAYDMLDDEVKNDGISYLSDEYIANNTAVFNNLSDEANLEMQELWTNMKSAQDDNQNKWAIPLFLILCIATSIAVLIVRSIKRKKDILY